MSLLWAVELRDLLLCFASDPEQGSFHLGLVGLCLLAAATALAGRLSCDFWQLLNIFNSPARC